MKVTTAAVIFLLALIGAIFVFHHRHETPIKAPVVTVHKVAPIVAPQPAPPVVVAPAPQRKPSLLHRIFHPRRHKRKAPARKPMKAEPYHYFRAGTKPPACTPPWACRGLFGCHPAPCP
jgi:hypothetical protein